MARLRTAAITVVLAMVVTAAVAADNFYSDVQVTFGDGHVWISEDGQSLQLAMADNVTGGSGFQSYAEFLTGVVSVRLRLVPGDSSGTVTTFYLTSPRNDSAGLLHDEIDMEFLGNVSGEPYVLHTNVYVGGRANREQRFYLWFDPTADFHNYTVLWNTQQIVWLVDGIPIRLFRNLEDATNGAVGFPRTRPMRVVGSLWDGDQWATQGGRIKTDWSKAPFIATYANIAIQGCSDWAKYGIYACWGKQLFWNADTTLQTLNYEQQGQLQWVRENFVIYDYCDDKQRFNNQLPLECTMPLY